MEAVNRLVEQRRLAAQQGVAAEPRRIGRPAGVLLIGGFQFLKAAVLLLTGTLLRVRPEMVNAPGSPLYPLLYLATRGKYDSMSAVLQSNVLVGLILFLGFYMGAIGFGILAMSGWARRTLILTCGMTVALFAKTSLFANQATAGAAAPDMTKFYVLLAVDTGVFLYLLRGNTAELFAAQG